MQTGPHPDRVLHDDDDASGLEPGSISPTDSELSQPRLERRSLGGPMGWVFGAVLLAVIAGTLALFAWMAGVPYDPSPVQGPQALPGVTEQGPG